MMPIKSVLSLEWRGESSTDGPMRHTSSRDAGPDETEIISWARRSISH